MEFVKSSEGVVTPLEKVPYEWDDNNYCTPESLWKDGKSLEFGVYPLITTTSPDYDRTTHKLVLSYTLSGKSYYQTWTVTPLDEVELNHLQDRVEQELRASIISDRNSALDNIQYNLGDGRIMYTRPQDYVTVTSAIDVMNLLDLTDHDWLMVDDTVAAVTKDELEAALIYGKLTAAHIYTLSGTALKNVGV